MQFRIRNMQRWRCLTLIIFIQLPKWEFFNLWERKQAPEKTPKGGGGAKGGD